MTTRTIYFVRHGITNFNVERRVQGEVDSELTAEGITTIKKIAKFIASNTSNSRPQKIITSPLMRAIQSSTIIAEELGIRHSIDDRLLELKRGIIEGKTREEFTQEEIKHGELFYKDPWNYRIPDGENLTDLKERVASFLLDILSLKESFVIVSHGFTIRMMIYLLKKEEVNYDEIRAPHETIYQATFRNGNLDNITTINV